MKRRLLAVLLALCMVASLMPMTVLAEETDPAEIPASGQATFSDVSGHWAAAAIGTWADRSVVQGYPTGKFLPNGNITRAELATIIVNVIGYTASGSPYFSDVKSSDWFYSSINRLYTAGIMNGDGSGAMRPNDSITRQETAALLARAFDVADDAGSANSFNDKASIASWFVGAVGGMRSENYIGGYPDGSFKPTNTITRAEVVTILNNMVTVYKNSAGAGDYANLGSISGNALINTAGGEIKSLKTSGDMYITEGVGSGSAALRDSTVSGTLVIRGGGTNTITVANSTVGAILMNSKTNPLIKISGGSTGDISLNNSCTLELKGSTVKYDDAAGRLTFSGDFDKIVQNSGGSFSATVDGTTYKIFPRSTIDEVVLSSGCVVDDMQTNNDLDISGTGTIEKLRINAEFVNIASSVDVDTDDISAPNGVDLKIGSGEWVGTGSGITQSGKYTVTYNMNTGSLKSNVSKTDTGGTIYLLDRNDVNPPKSGQYLYGWSTGNDSTPEYDPGEKVTLTKNMTLYPVWRNNADYTIYFDLDGTTGVNEPGPKYLYDLDDEATMPGIGSGAIPPPGYTTPFKGWSEIRRSTTAPFKVGSPYDIDDFSFGSSRTTTLYAIWTKVATTQYTITYLPNGGALANAVPATVNNVTSTTTVYNDSKVIGPNAFEREDAGLAAKSAGQKLFAWYMSTTSDTLDLLDIVSAYNTAAATPGFALSTAGDNWFAPGDTFGAITSDANLYAVWTGTDKLWPIEIGDTAGLTAVNDAVKPLHFKLTASLSLNNWDPIMGKALDSLDGIVPFVGSFDGGGNTITITSIDTRRDGSNYYAGLFGVIGNGSVFNLNVAGTLNTNSSPDATSIGSVAGTLQTGGSITNCSFTGTGVSTTNGSGFAGGIVGTSEGSVSYCYATGSVSGNTAGGIVGSASGGSVENCVALNDSVSASSGQNRGRVVGVTSNSPSLSNYAIATNFGNGGTSSNRHGATVTLQDVLTPTWWNNDVDGVWYDVWGGTNSEEPWEWSSSSNFTLPILANQIIPSSFDRYKSALLPTGTLVVPSGINFISDLTTDTNGVPTIALTARATAASSTFDAAARTAFNDNSGNIFNTTTGTPTSQTFDGKYTWMSIDLYEILHAYGLPDTAIGIHVTQVNPGLQLAYDSDQAGSGVIPPVGAVYKKVSGGDNGWTMAQLKNDPSFYLYLVDKSKATPGITLTISTGGTYTGAPGYTLNGAESILQITIDNSGLTVVAP